jgi:ankyrin repeat protein
MADNSPSLLGIVHGKPNKQKLFFIPCDDENPNTSHEISEHILFQYLLKDYTSPSIKEIFRTCKLLPIPRGIDHESKISQVETHRQKKITVSNSPSGIFVVFLTVGEMGHFWWSLETYQNHVVMQRSRDKDSVKNKFQGETREGTELIAEKLEGKGCMRQLLILLWIHMILDAKYQRFLSRCESVIPLVIQKITKIGYEYETDFTYSTLSAEEKNPDLLDIINFLSNVSNWHPLVVATYLGDTELLDRVQQEGQYNINGVYNNFTLLNLAILFSKTKMVQHLLGQMKADPTRRDEKGRNALHMAAKFNREKKIIDLLLNKIYIDQFDATGTTALHHAVMASNTEIVEYLLDNGADPKRLDQIGRSPLCLAAFYATDTKITDLLLQKKETVDVDDCDKFGVTALHNAAMASNSKMARHLLAKGADINRRDKNGLTPLHVAAFHANDMEMIDLFLNNQKVDLRSCDNFGLNVIAYAEKNTYGLRDKIIGRVKEIDGGVIKEYLSLKQAKFEMQIPSWKSLIWRSFAALTVPSLTWKENQPKLFLVPHADVKPGKGGEISEPTLIQFLANVENIKQPNSAEFQVAGMLNTLSVIDHCSNITRVHIYQSSSNSMANLMKAFHAFIIFQTTSDKDGVHWWSLDRKVDYIVLQRSRSLDAVKNKFGSQERKNVKCNIQDLVGKGSIKNLFTILWIHQVMEEFNPNKSSYSQSFVTFVSEQITVRDNGDHFTHQGADRNLVMRDLIPILVSGVSKWHPFFLPIYLGNAKLFGRIKELTEFEEFNHKLSPLNLAIAVPCEAKTVRYLLEHCDADPTIRDVSGRNALETAAMQANNTEMIDLLLKHESVKIDGCDESGRTALHFAAASSNIVAARHLIQMGANPNLPDSHGRSPLHLAAFFAKDIDIVEVLLNSEQVDVNSMDSSGQNSFYYAKFNKHGLNKKIVSRLEEKGIKKTRSSNSDPALELKIQYSDPKVGKFLPFGKMESNGGKRKQPHDPLHTATQSKGSQLNSPFISHNRSTNFQTSDFTSVIFPISPYVISSVVFYSVLIIIFTLIYLHIFQNFTFSYSYPSSDFTKPF